MVDFGVNFSHNLYLAGVTNAQPATICTSRGNALGAPAGE